MKYIICFINSILMILIFIGEVNSSSDKSIILTILMVGLLIVLNLFIALILKIWKKEIYESLIRSAFLCILGVALLLYLYSLILPDNFI